jgi:hypothetical protein
MGAIRVPGESQANPLLVLAAALDKTNQHLANISANTKKEGRHIYAMAETNSGGWGTYCLACSDAAEEYIHPCNYSSAIKPPPSHVEDLGTMPSTLFDPEHV